jgi:CP family cyanate transporter-like MFS transporter
VSAVAEPQPAPPPGDAGAGAGAGVGAIALLAALLLAALALRPQLVGMGPLIPEAGRDLGVSHAVAGLLGTIPIACMGLFALPAAWVASRLGTRVAVGACLGLIALAGLVRAVVPGAALVLLFTLPIGMGMGIAGALMPVAIKERFAHRPAFATGVYTTGINFGAASASAAAVPLAGVLGGWRGSLAAFSAVTILVCVGWMVLTRGTGARVVDVQRPRLPWRRLVVWGLLVFFGLQSVVYYGVVSWMPEAFQERGWSASSSGLLLAAFGLASLPGGLLVPWLADRGGSRRQWLLLATAGLTVFAIGIAALPAGGFAWAVLGGISSGAIFPLAITLPLDVADAPADVGAAAALMLGGGYVIAALGPFILGAVRDATGSFHASLWALAGIAFVTLLACIPLSPTRLRPS